MANISNEMSDQNELDSTEPLKTLDDQEESPLISNTRLDKSDALLREQNAPTTSPVHIPKVEHSRVNCTWSSLCYDAVTALLRLLLFVFFREVTVRGRYNLPPPGTPTLLVCAPHANQFVDPALVMAVTNNVGSQRDKYAQGRRLRPNFIIAESSFKYRVVAIFARLMGAISVPRAQDNLRELDPKIELYAPDLKSDPTLIRGRTTDPRGAPLEFKRRFRPKALLGLPQNCGMASIKEIIDDETIRLASPFSAPSTPGRDQRRAKLLTNGTNFKYADHIDNNTVFQNVFNHLNDHGCVGIFPEGGSHDRPSLLPIKAGVAIMALGAVAARTDLQVAIVPCGLHYFHRNKFRSRAVLEYGSPIMVSQENGIEYRKDPRATVGKLLKKVTDSLQAVTVNAPDFETLQVIQTARRLYQYNVKHKISLATVTEINRRLLMGYNEVKDDPRIQSLQTDIVRYHKQLRSMGVTDHQVLTLQAGDAKNWWKILAIFLIRLFKIIFFFTLALPGSLLFTPIFITGRIYAERKAEQGLKKSMVKIKGLDLLATWKLIVALVMAPILYVTYSLIAVYGYAQNWFNITNYLRLPCNRLLQYLFFYGAFILISYSSLQTGEKGFDLLKSMKPLIVSLVWPKSNVKALQRKRGELSERVTDICNELGPKVFPDYDKLAQKHLYKPPVANWDYMEDNADHLVEPKSRTLSSTSSSVSNSLSRVNSRGSLTDIPIFANARHRSYSQSSFSSVALSVSSESEVEEVQDDESESHGLLNDKISQMVRNRWKKEENDI